MITKSYISPLYTSLSDKVDAKTGMPDDYETFSATYRSMLESIAYKMKIPAPDIEDAVQEVQLKFWHKGGLDLYDPNKARFSTFFRRWAGKFLLQERDKTIRFNNRNLLNPTLAAHQENMANAVDLTHELLDNDYAQSWVKQAQQALQERRRHLLPLFELYIDSVRDGETLSQKQISQSLGCNLYRVNKLVSELRAFLTEIGLGVDSLYE